MLSASTQSANKCCHASVLSIKKTILPNMQSISSLKNFNNMRFGSCFLFFIEFEWIKVHVGDRKKLFK